MSWDQLEAITLSNRAAEESAAKVPPLTCPYDGSRLEVLGSIRNCPMGNYRWEG